MTQAPAPQIDPIGPNEGYGEGMVGPGQEGIAQEFFQEQSQADAGPELLLGKFKSVDDLARSYQELEKRLGRKGQEPEPEAPEPEAPAYSKEVGIETFGQDLADRFEEAGFNPFELNQKLADGELTLEAAAQSLAEASGFSPAVAEQFLRGGMPQGEAAAQGEIGEAEQAEIMALVGGQENFQALSEWAKNGGIDPERLAAYNAAVAAANRPAIEAYLLWMAAEGQVVNLQQQQGAVVEPQLVSGKAPVAKSFNNRSEMFEAMNRRDERGERLYDTDPGYRRQVEEMILKADFM